MLLGLKGYADAELEEWKRTRLTAWAAVAPHMKHKESPEKWLPLRGEKGTIINYKRTRETVLKMQERLINAGVLKAKPEERAAANQTEEMINDPLYLEAMEAREIAFNTGVLRRNPPAEQKTNEVEVVSERLPTIKEILNSGLPPEERSELAKAVVKLRFEQSNKAAAEFLNKQKKTGPLSLSEILQNSPIKNKIDGTENSASHNAGIGR